MDVNVALEGVGIRGFHAVEPQDTGEHTIAASAITRLPEAHGDSHFKERAACHTGSYFLRNLETSGGCAVTIHRETHALGGGGDHKLADTSVPLEDIEYLIINGNFKAAGRLHGGVRTSSALWPPIPWESL